VTQEGRKKRKERDGGRGFFSLFPSPSTGGLTTRGEKEERGKATSERRKKRGGGEKKKSLFPLLHEGRGGKAHRKDIKKGWKKREVAHLVPSILARLEKEGGKVQRRKAKEREERRIFLPSFSSQGERPRVYSERGRGYDYPSPSSLLSGLQSWREKGKAL